MTESQITKKTGTDKKQIIQKQHKFFINNINTVVGQALVESLRNDHENDENPHLILGSLDKQEQNEIPRGIYKIIDTEKISQFTKIILECDVIIYDLSNCDLDEAEFIIKSKQQNIKLQIQFVIKQKIVLKMGQFKEDKILIYISNVMTWSNTQLKIREKKDNEQIIDEEGLEDIKSDNDELFDDDDNQKKKIFKYTDKEFTLRRPLPQYEFQKQLENMCLQAGNVKSNLKTYVLCSGIKYGNDHSVKNSQANIVQAISKAIGTGQTKHIDISQAALEVENFDIFTLDLRLKPSKIFESAEYQAELVTEENYTTGVEDRYAKNDFEWNYKDGLVANIGKLNKEFNEYRGLRSNKIFIYGPPASGKTTISQKISQKFNIPHIQIQYAIEQAKNLNSQLGDEVRKYLEEKREELVEKALQEFENEKKKKKKSKGEPEVEFDSSKVVVKLSEELVFKIFKWRLSLPDQEKQEENFNQVEDSLLPENVIFLEGNEEFIRQRIKEIPEDKLTNIHYNEEGMNRRFTLYKQYNNATQGNQVLSDFFQQNNIETFKVDIQDENLFEQIQNFIERNGKFNINEEVNQLQENLTAQYNEEDDNKDILEQENQKQKEEKEKDLKRQQEEENKIKLEKIKNQEREKLDERSYTLRQYLADNIVPYLTEALIELCKTQTNDPVDKLADLLLSKSQEESYIENLLQIQIN
ncbi:hypothetical protein IMG5_145930 [Ichthyophthirius multifiliis]|uniref:P-loop containing nucleoside triphosphate hydrolase n=1 Tax=Ichthyophthirius multifiliis TaxID=5932 RepID=G0QXY6_ICHMU|nr:hypothetical protein IMG5_145930 [Ichthyophthirius multifiliis]EGR29938.1 hypothetical protein IMG5_145930 [Ichthyophthirius multifiliis]|eukprot:XP_004031174.1 hypothetical protein IMG5_145930 [Ichthyophthirius multifiliis]